MHSGSCLCEAIKYTVDDKLDVVFNCHCQFCRKSHGAEFVTAAMISSDKLELLEGKELLSKYKIPNMEVEAFRCFCSICGTRLFNHSPSVDMISLITATISSSIDIVPLANVNMESKNRNFEQGNGLPNFDTVPNSAEIQELSSGQQHNNSSKKDT